MKPGDGFAPGGLNDHDWSVVREDGWKLIQRSFGITGAPLIELYNVLTDPDESSPVSDAQIQAELLLLKDQALGSGWPYTESGN